MIYFRYLRELLDLFAKWWWAAITGVASIVSWLAFPDGQLTLGRTGISIAILLGSVALFLVVSILSKSFSWFVDRARPEVVRFMTSEGTFAFVVRQIGQQVHAGYLLTLFRHRDEEGEVPMAVLRVERGDLPLGDFHCIAVWIAPVHKTDLARKKIQLKDLTLRCSVPERVIEQWKGIAP